MKRIVVLVVLLTLSFVGCSNSWLAELDSILAAAAPALVNILQIAAIANGEPVSQSLVSKVNADATVIKTLASDFASASASAAPGFCQQLQAEISVYQTDQQLVLQAAQVKDNATQSKIALLSSLVAGTVSAITAVIPACGNAAMNSATPAHSASGFTSEYNAILLAKTGNTAVDAVTPNLKLHKHSRFMRTITLGRLQ